MNICHEGYLDCVRSFCDEEVPLKNFRVFSFQIFGGTRKYFYTENFRIYGTQCVFLAKTCDDYRDPTSKKSEVLGLGKKTAKVRMKIYQQH